MIEVKNIQVVDCWDLSGHGMMADLQHSINGLPYDLIIISETTGNKWKVKKRILFNNAFREQKQFEAETTTLMHLSFNSENNRSLSTKNILERESQNIFQYHLEPIDHKSKPEIGDILNPID